VSVVAIMTDSNKFFFHSVKANRTIWKLCSVFVIAHYYTIWQLPVFTSRQLYSACSSTQLANLVASSQCDSSLFHTFRLKPTPLHYLSTWQGWWVRHCWCFMVRALCGKGVGI